MYHCIHLTRLTKGRELWLHFRFYCSLAPDKANVWN